MKKAINAKQAQKILRKLGLEYFGDEDGTTFYATDEEESSVWEFETKKERDAFVTRS